MIIGPAPVLALLVGFLHACLFVVLRGSGGRRFVILAAAAILGAWTGDAVAGRLDLDPVRIGDFHVVAASIVAWIGIGLVVTMSSLAPASRRAAVDPRDGIRLEVRRRETPGGPDGEGEPKQPAPARFADPRHDGDGA